jgi:hypothetical protein
MKELFTAFAKAQAEMEAASKDSNNPFFKSKYADLNSVMGAVKPAFAKHGLAFVQVCHDAENCAKVETLIVHESGDQISAGCVSVPVSKHDAQGYGSALTYARRYSLAAAAGVGAEDDDGNAAAKAAPKKEQPKPAIDRTTPLAQKLLECGTASALQAVWEPLDKETKLAYAALKDECKQNIIKAQDAERAAA